MRIELTFFEFHLRTRIYQSKNTFQGSAYTMIWQQYQRILTLVGLGNNPKHRKFYGRFMQVTKDVVYSVIALMSTVESDDIF